MRLPPTLASIDNLRAQALVVFLPKNPLPLRGLLSLLDWRLCFGLSQKLMEDPQIFSDKPVIMADLNKLSFGPIFFFTFDETDKSTKIFDTQIFRALKVMNEADIENFVFSFPDGQTWVFDHWEKAYESHSVFKNLNIFDRSTD